MTSDGHSCFFEDDPGKLCEEDGPLYKITYDNPSTSVIYSCKFHLYDLLPVG